MAAGFRAQAITNDLRSLLCCHSACFSSRRLTRSFHLIRRDFSRAHAFLTVLVTDQARTQQTTVSIFQQTVIVNYTADSAAYPLLFNGERKLVMRADQCAPCLQQQCCRLAVRTASALHNFQTTTTTAAPPQNLCQGFRRAPLSDKRFSQHAETKRLPDTSLTARHISRCPHVVSGDTF